MKLLEEIQSSTLAQEKKQTGFSASEWRAVVASSCRLSQWKKIKRLVMNIIFG